MELEKVRKVDKKPEYVGVVPPNNYVKTRSRKCGPGKSAKAREDLNQWERME